MADETINDLEKKKLSLEIKEMQRPFYLRSGSWFSAATVLLALGGLIGQNMVSDLKIQRESLKAEKLLDDANKQVGIANLKEKAALAKVKEANVERTKALEETNAMRWEALELSRERTALEAQTAAASNNLESILNKVKEIREVGLSNEKLKELEKAIKETNVKLGYMCTPEEAAVYDAALELDKQQSELAIRRHLPWGLPKPKSQSKPLLLLSQVWWIAGYDKNLKIPKWVAYRLDGKNIQQMKQKGCWRPDPRLSKDETATRVDFRGSGYDRGHLISSMDMTSSELALASTGIYSNIVPQIPILNRKYWLALEQQVRNWASKYGTIYVLSGSLFVPNSDGNSEKTELIETIGTGKVAVPTHYFKIVIRLSNGKPSHLIAFKMANSKASLNGKSVDFLINSQVSVQEIEKLSELDFLPDLSVMEDNLKRFEIDLEN